MDEWFKFSFNHAGIQSFFVKNKLFGSGFTGLEIKIRIL